MIIDRNRIELKLLAQYLGPVTNQQAEILACVKALEKLRRPCRVEILSDSRYVIDTMVGKNRMKTNRPFWDRLIENCYGHHITWKWVRGHSGVTFQEAADRLARAASTVQCDLRAEDLDLFAEHLSVESNQLNIRSFEARLDAVVSRYVAFDKAPPIPKLDGMTVFPSAFSV